MKKSYLIDVKKSGQFNNDNKRSFRLNKVSEEYKKAYLDAINDVYKNRSVHVIELK